MIEIVAASTPAHLDAIRALWTAYWNELGFTPCFQGFQQELDALPGPYAPPRGRLLLALAEGHPAGSVALRPIDERACEAKRLYVLPELRGKSIGRILMDAVLSEARAAGYQRVLGDTMSVMATALAMYDRMGFRRRGPYPGSTEGAICIEYQL